MLVHVVNRLKTCSIHKNVVNGVFAQTSVST